MANLINWFEIPAEDINRAVEFYKKILGSDLQQQEMNGIKMAFFPMEGEGVGGSLCQGEGYVPSQNSALLYLNGGEDLSEPLSKVESAGGKIIMEKSKISDEIGFMAVFIDSEGNRMAFHSPK
ncbi:MAG: VOC family protein [Ignavibacteriae bacterium]|nr:VOC family protein [Ignavibacteriota bacterium]NOG98503.1 VOC family protein [Ignavibacteriota bacterium]